MLYHSSLQLIGRTPLVELSRIIIPRNNRIFAKLECANPAGGVKDRIALHILRELHAEGKLTKDSTIIEATAGNTGLGIAFVALHFGVRARLIVPSKFSIEKQILMRALGAEIINTPTEQGMQGAITLAEQMRESTPHALSINQFDNAKNPKAHYLTTAQEIWEDLAHLHDIKDASYMRKQASRLDDIAIDEASASLLLAKSRSSRANHAKSTHANDNHKKPSRTIARMDARSRLDYFIAGAGSGGSFSGVARFFKEQDRRIQAVLADPIGSILGGGDEGCAHIEGIGNCFIPHTMDRSLIDKVIKISDERAYAGVHMLAQEEGILAGISSGACLQACLDIAQQVENCVIVTLFADDLSRYFSHDVCAPYRAT